MRAYFFVNSWLSGIQKGLQVAHVVAEMGQNAGKETCSDEGMTDYEDWAEYHKTIIILEGGTHQSLQDIIEMFDSEDNSYEWNCFNEDEESLNNASTAVGIVLPGEVYNIAKFMRDYGIKSYERCQTTLSRENKAILDAVSKWDMKLIELLNSCPLAR